MNRGHNRAAVLEAHAEHLPLLRGLGRYVGDLTLPGMLHVAFVRSPHAHAKIRAIDVAAARGCPGVVDVLGGAGLAERLAPIRARLDPDGDYDYRETPWPAMAHERVRYVGEIVAAVIAADRYKAEDAAAAVAVDYEPLAAASDVAAALRDGAPEVHAPGGNVLFRVRKQSGDAGACFADAPLRLSARFKHPRVAGMSMEGCGVLARYDAVADELVFWSSTQIPHLLRDGLSRCLGMPAERIRVIAPEVGGAFGIKMQLFPEEVILAYAARQLGRPVKWIQDRSEHLIASFHARDVTVEAEIAADGEGRLLGLRAKAWCDVGAYSAFPLTCALEPHTIATALPGPYRWDCFDYEGYAVATNKYPGGAYRGVGFPIGPLVTETLIDRVARKLDCDPIEIRRRNLLRPDDMPFSSASGAVYDSGDYPALLQAAVDRADYATWREEQKQAAQAGRRLGIGVACFVEASGMNRRVYRGRGMMEIPAFESALIRVSPGGDIFAAVSTPSQGQGQRTTFRRLLSERLGVAPDAIAIGLGDTAVAPYGAGTFGSRSVVSGGGALLAAAGKLCDRLCVLAAARWAVPVASVAFADGGVQEIGQGGRRLSLAELAGLAYSARTDLPDGVEPGLEVRVAHDPKAAPFSAAAHLVLVEVDPRTGQVAIRRYVVAEDCGPIVNPAAVDGQVRGGIAQGIGCALYEDIVYDAEGQHLSATLQDYLVPGAGEVPEIDIVHQVTPSPFTEGGHKGVGESGTIGAPAAIVSAVMDALRADPPRIILPLSPQRVHDVMEGRADERA